MRGGNSQTSAIDLPHQRLSEFRKLKESGSSGGTQPSLPSAIAKQKSYTGFQQRNSVLPETIDKKQSHEELLYAEARLGGMLAAIPQKMPIGFQQGNRISLPEGIDKKQSHYAQELSRHEDVIAEADIGMIRPDKVSKT